MSTFFKKSISIIGLAMLGTTAFSQAPITLELPTGIYGIGNQPTTNMGLGPITAFGTQDSLPMLLDSKVNFNSFTVPAANQTTKVFMKFVNQQYTGLKYNTATTGLLFGGTATTSYGGGTSEVNGGAQLPQKVDPYNLFNEIGTYNSPGSTQGNNPTGAPGGPSESMFSAAASPVLTAGTGITPIWSGSPASSNDGNGAFSVFTVAQVQYDGGNTTTSDPVVYPRQTTYNANTRYYYGDLVVSFNRFVKNPVIHLAGLGGAYRYLIPGGNNTNLSDWRSTYFSTELESSSAITRLSGNSFFQVVGSNSIVNTANLPSGGSTSDPGSLTYPFDDLGAGSGSVMVLGTVRTVVFRVYLRGAPSRTTPTGALAADFAWSTARQNTNNYNREPVTGDLWWVSVSTTPPDLIPLPATGVNLSATLVGNDVNLIWKTLSEFNTNHFEVERSTDGVNFVRIGEKAAAGNSVSEKSYTYGDANITAAMYYYRLKMVDMDGKVAYSNVARVNKSHIKTIKTFPNPVTDVINIEFASSKGSYTVTLVNQGGQEVKAVKADITNTTQYVRMDRGELPTGMYYVRVKDNASGQVFAEKIIIK